MPHSNDFQLTDGEITVAVSITTLVGQDDLADRAVDALKGLDGVAVK